MTFTAAAIEIFWAYVHERECIRLRRAAGAPPPWTDDPVLQEWKFTNVRREHDRTTRAFVDAYRAHAMARPEVALLNCAAYRWFGTAEFAAAAGWLTSDKDLPRVVALAAARLAAGDVVFTGAYKVSNSGYAAPKERVVGANLAALWGAAPGVVEAIESTNTWEAGYRRLSDVRGHGGTGFMAKEVLQDYLLWRRKPVTDAATFTPVGPGARRGLDRLLGRPVGAGWNERQATARVVELLGVVGPNWRKAFPRGGKLTAHDVQFCLCEVDKMLRVRNREGTPRSRFRARAAGVA